MRKAATRFGAALLAAAGLMSTHALASADPDAHQVRYTITTGQEATLSLNYLAADPASKAALDANPDAYLRNQRVTVAPGAPWVFETTLNDTSWAYVRAGGAARYNGTPNPHCDIAVDGNIVVQQDGETAATCALKPWELISQRRRTPTPARRSAAAPTPAGSRPPRIGRRRPALAR